jgi:chaperone required for assembly of F1-ATPase
MSPLRRFYKDVTVKSVAERFAIALDGKELRTPAKKSLFAPNAALADALADEWRAQGEQIDPLTMPLNRLLNAAIDRIDSAKAAVIDQLMAFAESDLLCYRAAEPADLVERQRNEWDPLLGWVRDRFGVHLSVRSGIMPFAQPGRALAALRAHLETRDIFVLAGLGDITALLGSLALGLAVAEGRIAAEEAFALSQLDELWQESRWGRDDEAEIRRQSLGRDVLAAGRLLELLRESGQ